MVLGDCKMLKYLYETCAIHFGVNLYWSEFLLFEDLAISKKSRIDDRTNFLKTNRRWNEILNNFGSVCNTTPDYSLWA